MKKKMIIMVSAFVIVLGSIGGFVYAQGNNPLLTRTNDIQTIQSNSKTSNHCSNNEDMIQIMRENGFEDMANYMEEGNYDAMDVIMNNLTDEDYARMIEIMKENGYDSMAKMMDSIGREEMLNMHNSMHNGNSKAFGAMRSMMGGTRQ